MAVAFPKPANLTNDPVVDACITYSQDVTHDISKLYNDVFNETVSTSKKLRERYTPLRERIRVISHKLKPAAVERYRNMYHDDGALLKNALEAAIGSLKQRHKLLLSLILDRVHEAEYDFPLDPPPPNCLCNRVKTPAVNNIGWIVSGCSATFALLTLTPLGEYIAPYVIQSPQFFGETARRIGIFFTKVFTEIHQASTQSPSLDNAGKFALILSAAYPAYWFAKAPVTKTVNFANEKFDDFSDYVAENPMKTLLVASTAYYAGLWILGIELKFVERHSILPFHARLALSFGGALATPPGIGLTRKMIDEYKRDAMFRVPPPEPPEDTIDDTEMQLSLADFPQASAVAAPPPTTKESTSEQTQPAKPPTSPERQGYEPAPSRNALSPEQMQTN